MADVGLGVLNYAVENLYDKIPNKAFTGETYKPKKLLSKSRRRNSSSRRNSRDDFYQERSDSRYNREREYKGAVAGAAGGYAADELYDDYRQPAPRRRSEDDDRINSYNDRYQSNPNGQSQGDPSFGRRRNRAQTLDGQDESEESGGVRTRDITMARGQDRDYPPARGNDYHRYDPRDYQPRGGYDSDYGPNRNDQQDPYDRPQSADPRRERDRNSDRDRRSGRNRKSSPSPAGLRGIMKKNFEMSDTGITSGALGAIAGGLIGNEVGKGLIPALAGAFIGGLGANAWEARDHKKASSRAKEDKERRKQKDRSRYDDSDDEGGSGGGGGGGGGGRSAAGGRRGSGYYDGQGSDERGGGGGGNGGGYYQGDNQPQNPNGPNAGYVGAYGGQSRGGNRSGGGDNYRSGSRGGQGQGQSQAGQDYDDSEDEETQRARRKAEKRKLKEQARQREELGDGMAWGDVLHS